MEGKTVKILVTGGAGYIGSHTSVELLDAGYEIVIADNFSNSKPEVLERIRKVAGKDFDFCECDLCDKEALDKVFDSYDIDAVIHFAGLKAVGESCEKPLEYYRNNLVSTMNLCESMREHGCKKLVFSSSATVYGMNNTAPYTEDMPLSATNPYGWTKFMIEEMLRGVCAADKEWSVALLRYFNPIGAHSSGQLGEDPNGIPNNLFPYIMRVAVGKLPELGVFGDDYDTPDGTGVRDYIHVVDLAKGHIKALEWCSENVGAEPFNLGTGNGSSVLEVLHGFEKACGKTLPYSVKPRRAGDIATSFADCSKAEKQLGWKAELGMEDMCRDGWNFIKNNPNGL